MSKYRISLQNIDIFLQKKNTKDSQTLQQGGNQQSTLFPFEFFMRHVEQAQSPFFTEVIKILQIDCHSQHHTVLYCWGEISA